VTTNQQTHTAVASLELSRLTPALILFAAQMVQSMTDN
jgi:hypothetical protein